MNDQETDRKRRRELADAEFEKSNSELNRLRDEQYRVLCNTYARRKKLNFVVEDGCTYLDTAYGAILLCKPTTPECLWYQTYWALKDVAPPKT